MLICKYFLDCRESSAFSQEYHVWRRLVRWPDVFFLALRAYDGSWHYSPILFRVFNQFCTSEPGPDGTKHNSAITTTTSLLPSSFISPWKMLQVQVQGPLFQWLFCASISCRWQVPVQAFGALCHDHGLIIWIIWNVTCNSLGNICTMLSKCHLVNCVDVCTHRYYGWESISYSFRQTKYIILGNVYEHVFY